MPPFWAGLPPQSKPPKSFRPFALLGAFDLGTGARARLGHPDAVLHAVLRGRRRGVGLGLVLFVVEPVLMPMPLAIVSLLQDLEANVVVGRLEHGRVRGPRH